MPATKVHVYKELDGQAPVLEWLRILRKRQRRAFAKCAVRIRRLAELGHELRRPEADFLRDGIFELRIRDGSVNHRILYFFFGRNLAILAHALTKEDRVPDIDIERALQRRKHLERNPDRHILDLGDLDDLS